MRESLKEFVVRLANEASARHGEYGEARLRLEGAFDAYRTVLTKLNESTSESPNEPTDSPTPVAE